MRFCGRAEKRNGLGCSEKSDDPAVRFNCNHMPAMTRFGNCASRHLDQRLWNRNLLLTAVRSRWHVRYRHLSVSSWFEFNPKGYAILAFRIAGVSPALSEANIRSRAYRPH